MAAKCEVDCRLCTTLIEVCGRKGDTDRALQAYAQVRAAHAAGCWRLGRLEPAPASHLQQCGQRMCWQVGSSAACACIHVLRIARRPADC